MTAPPTDDFEQIEMPDERMRERIAAAQGYTLALLYAGPQYTSEDARAIVWEHGRRNMQLNEARILPVVCPVRDDSPLCGIGIFTTDLDGTASILDGDPGVQRGVFTYEVHPVSGFAGSTL